jgi:hypothetical protein
MGDMFTDIQKATISSLKRSCEKLGFDNVEANDENDAEYSQVNFVQGSDILNILRSLAEMEETLDSVEEDPSISILKDCMERIKVLDDRKIEFEQVEFYFRWF